MNRLGGGRTAGGAIVTSSWSRCWMRVREAGERRWICGLDLGGECDVGESWWSYE